MKMKKFIWGVLGGFCLVLARSIFATASIDGGILAFIGSLVSSIPLLLLAGIWSITCDDDKEGALIKFGFAAPGVILSLVMGYPTQNKPAPQADSQSEILNLDASYFSILNYAYAGEPLGIKVQTVKKSDLKPSFQDGMRAFYGNNPSSKIYAYVIGKTTTIEKAKEVSSKYQKSLKGTNLQPKIYQIEGQEEYYVFIGDLSSFDRAEKIRKAFKNIYEVKPSTSDLANLNPGQVVNLKELEP
jgi:hypothetical protein